MEKFGCGVQKFFDRSVCKRNLKLKLVLAILPVSPISWKPSTETTHTQHWNFTETLMYDALYFGRGQKSFDVFPQKNFGETRYVL